MRFLAALVLLQLGACASLPDSSSVTVVEEAWLTVRDEGDNVDSVATWIDGEHSWLLATAKETDLLIIYDAVSGARLGETGGTGNAPGRFLRPNGIFVLDNRVWVVERDNHRVHVLDLPDLVPVLIFGEDQLQKPYGIHVHRRRTGYRVFVTDSYETVDEQVPPDAALDARLHRFDLVDEAGTLRQIGHRRLGPTQGEGRLFKVESLWGDPEQDLLLVADEHPERLDLKVFDLEGRFQQRTLADGILRHEPEGTALYRCADGSGFWIVTDQDRVDNRFLVFDRLGFSYRGAFTGAVTRNTDGVWLHPEPLDNFPRGVFYAVHDDGNVGAFDWGRVLDALELPSCAAIAPD